MGRRTLTGRRISGILLLDKAAGLTSNAALQQIKRLFQARKAGHTGSLDPLATGLLPICLGEATKVSAFLLDADKRYCVQVRLGITTTTADAEGEVIATAPWDSITEAHVQALLPRFTGEIEQIPPMYSAVKHQGQRLYHLARQGVEVPREPRQIHIYQLTVRDWAPPFFILDVHCSKGTYVRTLAEDLGRLLGCGAHVSALRRTGVGPYGESGMVTLETLARIENEAELDAQLLPIHSALGHWPELRVSEDMAFYMKSGQPVLVPQAPTQGWVRLYSKAGAFLGVGSILDDGRVQPRRLLDH